MALEGSCSDESIEHDDVSSWQHGRDKRTLGRREGVDWLGIPKGGEFAFVNDFSAFGKDEALYFIIGGIPEVRAAQLQPEPWDESGTLASHSAGSKVAEYREFCRSQGRSRRGRKRKDQTADELGPPAPPPAIAPPLRDLELVPMDPKKYKEMLRLVRDETEKFHCWGCGADGRSYWKGVPIATKVLLVEGVLPADLLDEEERLAGYEPDTADEPKAKVVVLKTTHEMERATVNAHPALARAMAKLIAAGRKEEVRELMMRSAPRIIRAFERETGRRAVGLSIHWDSDLAHWNIWHTGLEKVIYNKGKGKDRVRYRRTAMNYNSSGPGLRAWRRSQLAFERLGKPTCMPTMTDLVKAQEKAMEDQGRMPGDWVVNDAADSVLEELLVEGHFEKELEEGFAEFVANEERRYNAGVAGKVSRMEKETLAQQIRNLQTLADDRGAELTELKAAAPENSAIRKLVVDFLEMLAEKPHVMAMLRRVPVLRELFASLASKVGVKLDLGTVEKAEAGMPVAVELGVKKASAENAGSAKKSVQATPAVVGPIMGS